MTYKMTEEERQAFLADVHVGVISVAEDGRGPLTVPVWYNYTPGGEVLVWTGGTTRKAELLKKAGRFSLCVQDEAPPYSYVSVEGPVVDIGPIDFNLHLRPMVYRYLDQKEGEKYIENLGGETAGTGDILVRMRPERWLSADYGKSGES